jgi:hypothetical protein
MVVQALLRMRFTLKKNSQVKITAVTPPLTVTLRQKDAEAITTHSRSLHTRPLPLRKRAEATRRERSGASKEVTLTNPSSTMVKRRLRPSTKTISLL